jgi:hypothetical protein
MRRNVWITIYTSNEQQLETRASHVTGDDLVDLDGNSLKYHYNHSGDTHKRPLHFRFSLVGCHMQIFGRRAWAPYAMIVHGTSDQ